MTNDKWLKYVQGAHQPGSLTSQSEARRNEAVNYCRFATKGWQKGGKILVLGCGDGYELKCLYDLGFTTPEGITFYDEEVSSAQKQGIPVIQGDMHELPFANESVDYIMSKETLEHAIAPHIVLYETNRILKAGGEAIHFIPSGPQKQSEFYHYFCPAPWVWADAFIKARFEIIEIGYELQQPYYRLRKKDNMDLNKTYDHVRHQPEIAEMLSKVNSNILLS